MYKYTLTRVHTQQCTYNTMLYIKWHMRAKNRVRTVIWRSRYSSPHRDLSVCFQGRDDQSICDRWLGLRFTDLKALEFPGGKVSQQRQNPQGEEYGVRKRHGRRQSAEKEAPFRKQAPCDDITKIVKRQVMRLLEGIQKIGCQGWSPAYAVRTWDGRRWETHSMTMLHEVCL